jgi:hypothetical protein
MTCVMCSPWKMTFYLCALGSLTVFLQYVYNLQIEVFPKLENLKESKHV